MNAKSLTIGGALTALVVGIIYQYGELITDDFLLLAALVLGAMIASYGVSWCATQAYKVLYFKPSDWKKDTVKRKIYRCAMYSGAGTMLLCGSFFLLADGLSNQEKLVVGIFWTLGCIFVGLSSPLVWRFVFDNLMPRFKQWARGSKTLVVRNEQGEVEKVIEDGKTVFTGEDEALDRPSEAKRVMDE